MSEPIQLIVGLGNPGREYAHTRHNAGANFISLLGDAYRANWLEEKKFSGLTTSVLIDNRSVRLLLPTTFMNRSGLSVSAIVNFYKIPLASILVAHDELDLSPGVARLKIGGGHGGHNGLRDIISALGNQNDFARLRIGIGHPGDAKRVADYVLKKASTDETEQIDNSIKHSLHVLPDIINGHMDKAMQALHTAK